MGTVRCNPRLFIFRLGGSSCIWILSWCPAKRQQSVGVAKLTYVLEYLVVKLTARVAKKNTNILQTSPARLDESLAREKAVLAMAWLAARLAAWLAAPSSSRLEDFLLLLAQKRN